MSSDSKSYVLQKWIRLAMLSEEIQKVVDTTTRKPRAIIQTCEQALHLVVSYSINLSKPDDKSRLTEWEHDCPAAPQGFWNSIKEHIQNIATYTQELGIA